jgi:hypothetical protein
MQNFIGPRQIKSVETSKLKTPEGKEIVRVVFEGDHVELFPRAIFDKTVTSEPTDFSQLAEVRKKIVTGQIIGVLKENDVQLQELNDIFKFVGFQSDIHFDKASNYLWTNNDDEFVPGMAVLARRTFLDAQRIIDDIPVKEIQNEPEGQHGVDREAESSSGDVASEGDGAIDPDA